VVPKLLVVSNEREQVVTSSDRVEFVANAEVGTKCALHDSPTTSNGKTEGSGDIVDHIHESVTSLSRREKGWSMTGQELGGRLAIGNVDIPDLEFVEEGTDVFGRLVRNGTSESIGQDTDPDGRVSVIRDRAVVDFYRLLVEPGESNEIDRCRFDTPLIKESDNLGIKCWSKIAA